MSRGRNEHLTRIEIERLMGLWVRGVPASKAAPVFNCSTRAVQVHYSRFIKRYGEPTPHNLTEDQCAILFSSWQIGRAVRKAAMDAGCTRHVAKRYYKYLYSRIEMRRADTITSPITITVPGGIARPITLASRVIEPEFRLLPCHEFTAYGLAEDLLGQAQTEHAVPQ